MWAETIPTELLMHIFKYLNVRDLLSCSVVCQRWRDAFDWLPDGYWRKFCGQNHWCTRTIAEKKSLPKNFNSLCPLYRDLYKSITLWPEIETAAIFYKKCPFKNVSQFKILNNNTLAILPDCGNGISDVIIYYDLNTFEEKGRQSFEFPFHMYDENDILITVVKAASGGLPLGVFGRKTDGKLYMMSKKNKQCLLISTLFATHYSEYEYKLFEDRVFFLNEENYLSVATLKNDCGSLTVETKVVDEDNWMPYPIVAFSISDAENFNCIHIDGFMSNYTSLLGFILSLGRLDFEVEGPVNSVLEDLAHYGFDWSYPALYNWLKDFLPRHITRITKIDAQFICRHGHIVVLGTKYKINIYVDPYGPDGKLALYNKKPNRSIDIRKLFEESNCKEIRKIEVVEIVNGHRILILYGNKLFQLDLVNEDFINVELFELVTNRENVIESQKRVLRKRKRKNKDD